MSKDATWTELIVIALIALPLLGGLVYVMWYGDRLPTSKDLVLSSCIDLVSKYDGTDISRTEPLIITKSGGSGAIGYQTLKVIWKQDEWKLNVQCEGYKKLETGEFIFVSLFSNGKNLTELVRREERKK